MLRVEPCGTIIMSDDHQFRVCFNKGGLCVILSHDQQYKSQKC